MFPGLKHQDTIGLEAQRLPCPETGYETGVDQRRSSSARIAQKHDKPLIGKLLFQQLESIGPAVQLKSLILLKGIQARIGADRFREVFAGAWIELGKDQITRNRAGVRVDGRRVKDS